MSRRRLSGRAAAVLSRHGISSRRTEGANRFSTGAVAHQEPQATDVEKWKLEGEEIQLDLPVPGPADPVIEKTETRFNRDYYLTPEQDHAVDLAENGGSLKIEAYAGAGKTSTLVAVGDALKGKRGLYIAFNKTIADEAARRFPSHVECRTAHSLAYAAVGSRYKSRLQRLNGTVLAEYLKLANGIHGLSLAATGNLVLDMLTKFTQSDSDEVSRDHGPWSALRSIEDKGTRYSIVDTLVPLARRAWSMMIDPKGKIPITHDTYLKVWALSKPAINRDFILFDEAQDANPLMLSLVCGQQAQQIFVGDRYQQIYSWRGAVNAMQVLDTDHACQISQSFRFGQPIADVANAVLNNQLGANVAIRGFDEVNSSVGFVDRPDVILCRTNGRLINTLINRLGRGDRVAVAGGCSDLVGLLRGAQELMAGHRTNQRDLALFATWGEVVEFAESESGSDLAPIVKLISDYALGELISALDRTSRVKERDADLILSTAHKSKGREWGSVRLENDFRHPDSKGYTDEETNLLYVAATRAINTLDITDCDAANIALDAR